MEIDETIGRWFKETNNALEGPYDGEDLLIHAWCLATVQLALNYFGSTLILLNNGRRLPAKALLRILGELIAKIVWCLGGAGESKTELRNRFERWRKSTLIEQRRIRKRGLKIDSYTEDQRAQLEELIAKDTTEIDQINLPLLPKIRKLFEKIFADQDSALAHGGMYVQFLRAVHPDIIALENTMDLKEFAEGKIDCRGDTGDDIEELKLLCLAHAYIFLVEIWKYYGLDVNLIKSEYDKILMVRGFGK